jgi:hypothetical protein
MAGIIGLATTFNVPNFVGEIFAVSPEDTPFTSAIGGLTGGKEATATEFGWEGYDLREPGNRQRLEGADAPSGEARVRFPVDNIVEIHQEAVRVSYTKLAAVGSRSQTFAGNNPVMSESAWQIEQELKSTARDIEWSFINGKYQKPIDNQSPRRTRGILEATTTNVRTLAGAEQTYAATAADDLLTANGHGYENGDQVMLKDVVAGAPLTADRVYYVRDKTANTFKVASGPGGAAVNIAADGSGKVYKLNSLTETAAVDLLQMIWDAGGIAQQGTATAMLNSAQKRRLSKIFITDKNYQESSRNVGGVNLTTFETDFGVLNIMLNRYMPPTKIEVVSLEQCQPVFLNVPGKGFMFVEQLAKTGSSENSQLYGEVGLEYGNERAHGRLDGLAV